MFVFDGVLHLADLSDEGLGEAITDKSNMDMTVALTNRLVGGVGDVPLKQAQQADGTYDLPPEFLGTAEAIYDWAFVQAPMDMATVGNVPLVSLGAILKDPVQYLEFIKQLLGKYPERLMFAGGVDPSMQLGGTPSKATLQEALKWIEVQVEETNTPSMKFYPVGWACDDREYAYPMYEKAQELGVKVIQFHKNLPTLQENVEGQGPFDLQQVARDFPDLTILLHHPMPLYFYETVSVVQRFENIHLVMTPLIHYCLYRPRLAQEMLGHLLHEIGSEKLYWGSEGVIVGSPGKVIEAFINLDMPADLREGFGYPQITDRDRANILGLNYARLYGIDVEAKKAELAALPAGR